MSKKPMTFKEYKKLNLSQISDEILSYWEDNDIFRKSIEKSNDKNPFIFFEGPPSANGLPGIHHVLARSIKDLELALKVMSRENYDDPWWTPLPFSLPMPEKKIALFNKANYLELAIYKSNPHTTGGASSLFGLSYRDIVTIKFN